MRNVFGDELCPECGQRMVENYEGRHCFYCGHFEEVWFDDVEPEETINTIINPNTGAI